MSAFTSTLACACFTILLASAAYVHGSNQVEAWRYVNRAGPESIASVVVRLRGAQSDRALEDAFWSISTPGSPDFRRFLDVDGLTALVGAPQESADAVLQWCRGAVSSAASCVLSPTRDYLFVDAPAPEVESLLNVRLARFERRRSAGGTVSVVRSIDAAHPGEGRGLAAVERRSGLLSGANLPTDVAGAVRDIFNVAELPAVPVPRAGERVNSGGDDPGQDVTPPLIRTQYNGPSASAYSPPATPDGSGLAVAEFEQAYFFPDDVSTFQQKYGLTVHNVTIVGKNKPETGYLGEASLDTQYMQLYGLAAWDFSQDQLDMVKYGATVLATKGAPKVHSVSWGSEESGFDKPQAAAWNAEFQKLGAAGFTMLLASGDSGTGHSGFFSCGKFTPTFPASSPYVTAVGGTYLDKGASETGWALSGGGFSNYFGMPSYQATAVPAYKSSASLPDQQYWNASGRGIPDVAALATNYQVIIQNSNGPISGTSAATPTFAALVAAANSERMKAGKSVLGFINPTLYKAGAAGIGYDVVAGNNKDPSCPAGFPATKGWDAITGLATPDWPTLKSTLLGS